MTVTRAGLLAVLILSGSPMAARAQEPADPRWPGAPPEHRPPPPPQRGGDRERGAPGQREGAGRARRDPPHQLGLAGAAHHQHRQPRATTRAAATAIAARAAAHVAAAC